MKKTEVVLIDDIDGVRADTTVAFSINGINYEIDLTEKHAAEMAEDFGKWESHARRVGGRTQRSSRKSSSSSNAAKIREWAHEKGIEVSERGRIPAPIVAQYEADQA